MESASEAGRRTSFAALLYSMGVLRRIDGIRLAPGSLPAYLRAKEVGRGVTLARRGDGLYEVVGELHD